MSLPSLFNDLAAYLQSTEFLATARHPTAFTRRRKLPLASLVALMLSGMRKSIQAELDTFFAHLQQQQHWTVKICREVGTWEPKYPSVKKCVLAAG